MPKGTYNLAGFCVVDAKPISTERLSKGSITCSKECAKIRRDAQRAQQDTRECRYCRKPSTPEDREAFARFRRLERTRPDILYPEQFEEWKKTVPDVTATPKAFAEHRAKQGNQ
jgi:hypothetical protein